jgi:SAM-dependent methyltransferase
MLGSWSLNRIAWSLRKISLPVKASDLVLDVGSGSSPHPAADVLLERYLDPKHRYTAMVIDRPTVLADACRMPFPDKAFDFVIAFHVLEHVADPISFLRELERVGKAGYIETPNAIFERLVPYDIHLLEVMTIKDKLVINKKSSARPDPYLNRLDLITNSQAWKRFFYGNPKLFHARYFWKDKINFEVLNPEVSSDWFADPGAPEVDEQAFVQSNGGSGIRGLGLAAVRQWHRLRKRNGVDLNALLVCPECRGPLAIVDELGNCDRCGVSYGMQPVPDFTRPMKVEQPGAVRARVAQC